MKECASGTEQRLNYAAAKDAQIKSTAEECASGMGQRSNYAVAKDAQIKLKMEECARGMGQSVIHKTNQLCLI